MTIARSGFRLPWYLRLLLVAVAIGGCLLAIRAAAAFGVSRVLGTYSLMSGNLAAAGEAVHLAPRDAEAHFADAAVLSLSGAPAQSLLELERAVALRPADYGLWSELGLLRDQTGDSEGALAAFNEAINRAPYYSQPRWNRGNVLLRRGDYEAAFSDLRQASQSNPDLMPGLIDLAWGVSKGDVNLTEQLAQIKSDKMRIAFALFLARHGKAKEALAQLGAAGTAPEATKRELVDQLLAKAAFKEAFEVWESVGGGDRDTGPAIQDSGFEESLSFGQGGFGWRVPRDLQATRVSLDATHPQSGARDLQVEFSGNSNPGSALLSQLILLEPAKHYRIHFAGRSQDIVTGGLPLLVVSDAGGEKKQLGASPPLAKGTSEWSQYSFEFTTTPTTAAVLLSLQRESCTTSPCPIFGAISLDSFSVELLK